mgnify:CR=1 FL=1
MIIYTLIGRDIDGAVLVESSLPGTEGNFPLIATQLLEKLREDPSLVPHGNRKTFIHRRMDTEKNQSSGFICRDSEGGMCGLGTDWVGGGGVALDYYFHVVHGESTYYICLSDDTGRQAGVNFSFLNDVQRDFSSNYSPHTIQRANAYGMNGAFEGDIARITHHYNMNRSTMATDPHVLKLTSEVDNLMRVIGKNISLVLDRGESIEDMEYRSQSLEQDAAVFKKRSTNFRRSEIMDNVQNHGILMGLVAFLIFLLYWVFAR